MTETAKKPVDEVYLAYGYDQYIRQWVSNELGYAVGGDNYRAIGILHNDRVIGGCVYHDYKGYMVEGSLATTDKRWCSRKVLKALFDFAFNELGCERFHAVCSKKNKQMRDIFVRLGFKQEGSHPKAHIDGSDAISYGMLKDQCKWIKK